MQSVLGCHFMKDFITQMRMLHVAPHEYLSNNLSLLTVACASLPVAVLPYLQSPRDQFCPCPDTTCMLPWPNNSRLPAIGRFGRLLLSARVQTANR